MTFSLISEEARAAKQELPFEAQVALLDVLESLRANPTAGRRLQGTEIWIRKHPGSNLQITYKFDEEKDVIEFLDFVAAAVEVSRNVFIGYSRQDSSWFEILREKLELLEDFGISFFARADDEAPEVWDQEVRPSLESANAALLMISSAFLSSGFVRDTQLPELLEKAAGDDDEGRLKLLWFLVSACDLDADTVAQGIRKYQALLDPEQPLDGVQTTHRDKVLDRMLKKIAQTLA